jgi:hypothetical protein
MTSTDLTDLVEAQRQLQLVMPSGDPMLLDEHERAAFILWNAYALDDELHEATSEVGWKPWATSRHVNYERGMKELVDAFHFFMNLMMAFSPPDVSVEELVADFVRRYDEKHAVNAKRQADGYDGVAGKCENCHRDESEAEVFPNGALMCPCGHVVRRPTL